MATRPAANASPHAKTLLDIRPPNQPVRATDDKLAAGSVAAAAPAEPDVHDGGRQAQAALPPGRDIPRGAGAPGDAAVSRRDEPAENLRCDTDYVPEGLSGLVSMLIQVRPVSVE